MVKVEMHGWGGGLIFELAVGDDIVPGELLSVKNDNNNSVRYINNNIDLMSSLTIFLRGGGGLPGSPLLPLVVRRC